MAVCGLDYNEGRGLIRQGPGPGDFAQRRIQCDMQKAAETHADQKRFFGHNIADEEDKRPNGGAVCQVAVMVMAAIVDEVEPEHVEVWYDCAHDDA